MYLCRARACCRDVRGRYIYRVRDMVFVVVYVCGDVEKACLEDEGLRCIKIASVPREVYFDVVGEKELVEVVRAVGMCRYYKFRAANAYDVIVLPPCESVPKTFKRAVLV